MNIPSLFGIRLSMETELLRHDSADVSVPAAAIAKDKQSLVFRTGGLKSLSRHAESHSTHGEIKIFAASRRGKHLN